MNAYTDLEVKAMENMMVVDSDYEEDQEEHKIMIWVRHDNSPVYIITHAQTK